jgi:hypothetical protein
MKAVDSCDVRFSRPSISATLSTVVIVVDVDPSDIFHFFVASEDRTDIVSLAADAALRT